MKLYNTIENEKDLSVYIRTAREEIKIYNEIIVQLKLALHALKKYFNYTICS